MPRGPLALGGSDRAAPPLRPDAACVRRGASWGRQLGKIDEIVGLAA